MQVNLAWTLPTTRTNGQPLAVSDIGRVLVFRNGTQLALIPTGTSYADPSPLTGDNAYTVVIETLDAQMSAHSNMVTVTVVAPPASAVTDLTGSLIA